MNDRRATILVVDDEPQNLHLLGEMLRDDYELLIATSGEDVFKRAHADAAPDLILLDIMMPGMSGFDVCRQLQGDALTRNIPVIFITAKDNVEDETEGLALGAVDYITKPFSPAIVKARVKTHLKLKAQTDQLIKLAVQDGLTGLSNRRHFDQRLQDEWRRIVRSGGEFTLVMMDVDHFKQYNDHYGHGAGDQCLRQVAAALDGVVNRACDVVARYGGEEFVALLPTTDARQGMLVGESFRQQVEALKLEHSYSPVADVVTISVGVASCIPKQHSDPASLLEAADRMLYQAKKIGRNRVVACSLDSDKQEKIKII